ncbi:MAG TPA: tyrosine--tRNA ligase [Acidimicrobiales bacterium]|nr:tyrosine--tRNA ligase [Acidimicrobiales bacterium]
MPRESLWEDLTWRGLVHQTTSPDLAEKLDTDFLTAYIGFDPTADSLHIGSLLQLTTMRRLQRAGHRVIGLIGGGTGLIGDPSGRDSERQLLDDGTLERNSAAIRSQVERFFEGPDEGLGSVALLDNKQWLRELRVTDFLRDVGKLFSVNEMIRKESVRARLEGREQGISYTEFSYMLLQAYDFLHLYDIEGCTLQLGGSDQWGNITEGIDLIRRLRGGEAYGLTSPLVLLPSGAKVGKTSAGGQIWLDPAKTSPYAFYQSWYRADDRLVGTYLRFFTFLPQDDIVALDTATETRPEARAAQQRLAEELTTLVHGEAEMRAAQRAAAVLFTEDIASLDERLLLDVLADAPSGRLPDSMLVRDAMVACGLAKSQGDARRTLEQGGAYVNNKRVDGIDAVIDASALLHGRYAVLRRGKRDHALLSID